MARLASFRLQQMPLYSNFILRDPTMNDEDPDDAQARSTAREVVIGASQHRVYLHTAQSVVDVRVDIELWDIAPPDTPTEEWDEQHETAFTCPTGQLIVENPSAGPIALEPDGQTTIMLPDGITDIALRAYARNLDITEEIEQVYEQTQAAPFDELRTRLHRLDGQEQYLVQIWPTA